MRLVFCLLISSFLFLPDSCSRPIFLWLLEKGGAPRREAFPLSPVPARPSVRLLASTSLSPQLSPLPAVRALSAPKQRMASVGSTEGATHGYGAALDGFWHPAIGQSALERNYLEGLKTNQRKGVGTVAVFPLLP